MRLQRKTSLALGVLLAGAAAVAAAMAQAQSTRGNADPAAGRALALSSCTGCHIVAPDQPFKPIWTGPPHPPDFKEIANRPNLNTAALQHHLATLPAVPARPGMANRVLTDTQLRDVVAFIASLRDKPAGQ